MHRRTFLYSTLLVALTAVPSIAQAQSATQEHCREFTQPITIDGEEVQGFGTACKSGENDDWKIVSQAKPREAKSEQVIVKEHSAPQVVILKKKQYPRYGYNNYGYSRHNHFVDKHYYYKNAKYHNKSRFGHGYHKKSHYKKKHYAKKYY